MLRERLRRLAARMADRIARSTAAALRPELDRLNAEWAREQTETRAALARIGAELARTATTLDAVRADTARLPRSLYLGEHTALTVNAYGHIMVLDSRDRSLGPHLLLGGAWEEWIVRELRTHLKPGMTTIDIGANAGVYSLVMGEDVGPSGFVHVFEPDTRNADLLWWSLELNGFHARSRLHRAAVGDANETVTFRTLLRSRGGSSLNLAVMPDGAADEAMTTHEVEMVRLDDLLGNEARIDLVKIDAEGAEPRIIRGAMRLLERQRDIKLFMEFAPAGMPGGVAEARQLFADLRGLGFVAHDIRAGEGLVPFAEHDIRPDRWAELLLARPSG